jgi:hypothetical protein
MEYKDYTGDSAEGHGESVLWPLFLFSITLFGAGLWIVLDSVSSYDFMMGFLAMLVFGPTALFAGYKLKKKDSCDN